MRQNAKGAWLSPGDDGENMASLARLYVVGFVLLFTRGLFQIVSFASVPDVLDKALLVVGLVTLALHCATKFSCYKGRRVLIAAAALMGIASYIGSGETVPIIAVAVLTATATAGNMRAVLKLWLLLMVVPLAVLVIAYGLTYLFDSQALHLHYRHTSDTARHAFFLVHPNMFGGMVLMVTAVALYLSKRKTSMVAILAVVVVAAFVYLTSRSKTSSALIVLLPFLLLAVERLKEGDHRLPRMLVAILPVGLFALVFLVAGPLYVPQIGDLLTGRVVLWHQCYINQGLTLFGQPFSVSTSVTSTGYTYYYTTLDDAYAMGMYVYGLAFCAWFCWIVFRVCRSESLSGMRFLPIMVLALLFGVTEVHMLNPLLCGPLLMLSGAMRTAAPQKGVGACLEG